MGVTNFLSNSIAASAGSLLASQASLRIACHRQPRPMPHQFAAALDHPLRLRYRDVSETLGLYGFVGGMTVLDLGCGTGTFTIEMARMVGDDGIVHAVDIQQPLLDELQDRALDAEVADRIRVHNCGAYNLPFDDNSCDLAILIATLSQIPDKLSTLLELRRVLMPGARLVISEELPDPAYAPARTVRNWAEAAGFVLAGKTGSFFCYNMVFENEKILVPEMLD